MRRHYRTALAGRIIGIGFGFDRKDDQTTPSKPEPRNDEKSAMRNFREQIQNLWRRAAPPSTRADEKATYATMRDRIRNAWKESK